MPDAHRVPGPEAAARARALLEEMHVRLLTAYPADAVIHATTIAELALREISGMPTDARADLGALIDELQRTRRTEAPVQALADTRWLHQLGKAIKPFAGQVRPERDADARRASQIATRLAQKARLVTTQQAAVCEAEAMRRASAREPSALHWLDRHDQRQLLQKRLAPRPRVLVVLFHGEVGQGHEHFADVMTSLVRSVVSGWREVRIEWPPPTRPLGVRLATLLEELSRRLGVDLDTPHDDPTHPDGRRAWRPALDRIVNGIHGAREPMLLRHVVGSLVGGSRGDGALVDAYVDAVWNTVAQRAIADHAKPDAPGEPAPRRPPVVVSLDLRRIERSGFPLTSPWRHARRDLATARAIARILDAHHLSHGGICVALPELTSVPPHEIADWLRHYAGRDREAAKLEARELVAQTRGGRFDQVLQRLTAHHLDRIRNPR